MSTPDLPSTLELASLAVALGKNKNNTPAQVAEQALKIYKAAHKVLVREKSPKHKWRGKDNFLDYLRVLVKGYSAKVLREAAIEFRYNTFKSAHKAARKSGKIPKDLVSPQNRRKAIREIASFEKDKTKWQTGLIAWDSEFVEYCKKNDIHLIAQKRANERLAKSKGGRKGSQSKARTRWIKAIQSKKPPQDQTSQKVLATLKNAPTARDAQALLNQMGHKIDLKIVEELRGLLTQKIE